MAPDNVITMRVSLPSGTYTDNKKIAGFWERFEEQITSLPGMRSAALVYGMPPMRAPNMNDTDFEGFVKREGGPIENVDFDQVVTKDYFSTMGIRLMEGRLFDDRDTAAGTPGVDRSGGRSDNSVAVNPIDGQLVVRHCANRCGHVRQRNSGAGCGSVGGVLCPSATRYARGAHADVALRVRRLLCGLTSGGLKPGACMTNAATIRTAVLAGIIAPERKGSRGPFLRKNRIQSRTASLGKCFRVEFPIDHHLHRFANRVVHVSE